MAALFDEGIQITNTESTTATKVNVQEANGEVNTQTINTAFNKNFGTAAGTVVEGNDSRLSDARTPLSHTLDSHSNVTITTNSNGEILKWNGTAWVNNTLVEAGIQPAGTYATGGGSATGTNTGDNAVNSLYSGLVTNATHTGDVTGSTALTIANGAVKLAKMANVATGTVFYRKTASTGVPEVQTLATLKTDLAITKTDVGLGNIDNTSDANKPISTATQSALDLKQNTLENPITGTGTINYIPKFTGSGTLGNSIVSQDESGGIVIDGAVRAGYLYMKAAGVNKWVFGGNSGEATNNFNLYNFNTLSVNFSVKEATGNASFSNDLSVGGSLSATSYTGSATLTGTPTAPTAEVGTNTTQIASTAFVLANTATARPYKVYTALLTQTGTDAPVATVLENTLGGTVVWTRFGTGVYKATLSNAFTSNKTFLLTGLKASAGATYSTILTLSSSTASDVRLMTTLSDAARTLNDGLLTGDSVEIRVYN